MASTYKKKAIPDAVRREVALLYGCEPGGTAVARCHICKTATGRITWHRLYSGRPGAWVSFELELDHVYPEVLGGPATAANIRLACRSCNRSKGARV